MNLLKYCLYSVTLLILHGCSHSETAHNDAEYVKFLEEQLQQKSNSQSQIDSLQTLVQDLSVLIELTFEGSAQDAMDKVRQMKNEPHFLEGTNQRLISMCEEQILFASKLDSMTIDDWRKQQDSQINSARGKIAHRVLKEIELSYFLVSILEGSVSALEDYLDQFPEGQYTSETVWLLNQKKQESKALTESNYSGGSQNRQPTNTSTHYPAIGPPIPSATYNHLYTNPNSNSNLVHVNGYYRKDGTYVKPHVRTAPNSTKTDNLRFRP